MRFLEKDLETIIHENWDACYERGLDIAQFDETRTNDLQFRQLNLGGYGIADLVNIRYEPRWQSVFIQVVECKKDEINVFTYGQAHRYLHAIASLLESRFSITHETHRITSEIVLVGRTFDFSGDFIHIYTNDPNCQAITYEYNIDGMRFCPVPKTFKRMEPAPIDSSYKALIAGINKVLENSYLAAEHDITAFAELLFHAGDPRQPIAISAHHVGLNEKLILADPSNPF